MAGTTMGTYLMPGNYRNTDKTAKTVTYIWGSTHGSVNDNDVTLSAFGSYSSGNGNFHLTDVWIQFINPTVPAEVNARILLGADTIACIDVITATVEHYTWGEMGLVIQSDVYTSTLQLCQLVMSGTAATGCNAVFTARGYFEN